MSNQKSVVEEINFNSSDRKYDYRFRSSVSVQENHSYEDCLNFCSILQDVVKENDDRIELLCKYNHTYGKCITEQVTDIYNRKVNGMVVSNWI